MSTCCHGSSIVSCYVETVMFYDAIVISSFLMSQVLFLLMKIYWFKSFGGWFWFKSFWSHGLWFDL